ncbi:hypothetical protein [Celeribacter sp.]|uniref:hypothetical protein n=1 Tax=Celeribacter sp. TaxID=1890673 RepID=UPI003A901A3F
MTSHFRNISVRTGTFVSFSPILQSLFMAGIASIGVWHVSSSEGFEASAIYSGIFDLLSIFTGFLATFYVFVVTKGNKFLERIKDTPTYRMVLKLLKFTILWSAAMIAFTYILMIVDPSKFDLWTLTHSLVFFWLANCFLIAINFARCVGQFMTIVEAGD